MNNKIPNLVSILFQRLGTTYTQYHITDFFKVNTPSPDSISRLLSHYDIESMTVRFSTEELGEVDFPILILLKEKYYILEGYDEGEARIISPKGRKIVKSKEAFEQEWEGVALLLDAENMKEEPNYEQNRRRERNKRFGSVLTAFLLITFAWFLLPYFQEMNGLLLGFTFLGMLGVFTSYHLVKLSNGMETAITGTICQVSKSSSCRKVLKSSGAKIFGIPLADVGIVFFSYLLVLSISSTLDSNYLSLLKVISFASLGFVFFSVFYQIKLKTWCPLCLVVVLIVLAQFVSLLGLGTVSFEFANPSFLVKPLLLLASVSAIWMTAKNAWLNMLKVTSLRKELDTIKTNPEIQNLLVEQGKPIQGADLLANLELNNGAAANKVIFVTSAMCQPCESLHSKLEGFSSYFQDYLSIKVVPMLSKQDNIQNRLGRAFLNLEKETKLASIYKWFQYEEKSEKSFEKWSNEVTFTDKKPDENEILEWLSLNRINYTPCIIVNGRIVNNMISIDHLKDYLKRRLNGE